MSEMIERVAKAIYEAMDLSDGLDGTAAKTYARAAIEAMREPTEAMLNASYLTSWDADEVWKDMIDAALQETSK